MKLKQKEYCHNCDKYVIFEFDDTTDKQVIFCPNCNHEHYRELDEGTIINIRVNPACREIHIAKMPDISSFIATEEEMPMDVIPCKTEVKKVLGTDEYGNAIVEGKGRKTISQRRWGRDPRQG